MFILTSFSEVYTFSAVLGVECQITWLGAVKKAHPLKW